jgi:hypothetical protein
VTEVAAVLPKLNQQARLARSPVSGLSDGLVIFGSKIRETESITVAFAEENSNWLNQLSGIGIA